MPTTTRPLARLALALLLVAGGFWIAFRWLAEVTDDAFISFRYGRHLVDGLGLVFNPGERVEGYTNFLWTLLMAVGYRLGLDLPRLSQALGALAAAGVVLTLVGFSRRQLADRPFRALDYLAAALVATNPLFIHNAGNGLETALFTMLGLMSLCSWADERGPFGRPWITGTLLGLAYLTRPDTILWVAVFAGLDAVALARDADGRAARLRRLVAWGATFAAIGGPHMLWRLAYYGDWVPNTFHVKVGTNWQWGVLGLAGFGPAMGLLTAVAVLVGPPVVRARWATCAALVVVLDLAFIVHNGGGGGRYEAPLLPMIFLLLQETVRSALARLRARRPARAPALAAALGVVLALAVAANTAHEWRRARQAAAFSRLTSTVAERLARCLEEATGPDDAIAVVAAGVLPYYADRPIVDMLGLNDRHIARQGHVNHASPVGHQRYDGAYVIARRPRVVLVSERSNRAVAAVADLLDSAEFRRRYAPVDYPCRGARVTLFVDRDRPLTPQPRAAGAGTGRNAAMPTQ